ncbi:MAG: PAS domain-containing protein, partial [Bacteroidota bacterium]
MKTNNKTERELITELESAYQKVFEKESQLKEHGHREGNGTARYQTMSDVRDSEERYRRLFESAQDGIFILNGETGAITDANPYIIDSLGYSLKELKGKQLWEIGAFADVKESKAAFEELQQKEYIRYNNLPLKTKKGENREVEFVSNSYRVSGEKIIQCNIRDNTERIIAEQAGKRAGESLIESEERYRRLFETAQDGILILDAESGTITDANPFIVNLLGYIPEELIGKRLWEIGAFVDVKDSKAAFEELQRKEYIRYEDLPLKTKNGQSRQVEFVSNVYLVKHKKVIQCNIRDITERKKGEETLAKERNQLRTLIDNIPDYIYIKDTAGRYLLNNTAHNLFLQTPNSISAVGKTVFDFFPKELAKQYDADDRRVFESGSSEINREEPVVDKEGHQRWNSTTKVSLRDNQGKIVGLVGISRDITERKHSELALSESEKKYRGIFENVQDVFFETL